MIEMTELKRTLVSNKFNREHVAEAEDIDGEVDDDDNDEDEAEIAEAEMAAEMVEIDAIEAEEKNESNGYDMPDAGTSQMGNRQSVNGTDRPSSQARVGFCIVFKFII